MKKGGKILTESEIKEEKEDYEDLRKSKRAKIIVRNLPFRDLSEKKVKEWFKEFGDIKEIKLLRKDDNKFVGCGFVQFKEISSAAAAVEKANEREISGRKIIVDWAVPKDIYLQRMRELRGEVKDEDGSKDGEELPYEIDTKPDSNIKKRKFEHAENSDEDESEDEKMKVDHKFKGKKMKTEKPEKIQVKSNDVEEGKTIFIRNIPFSASNDDLKECFKKYGAVEYALICVDKLTEHSKGSGFVKFKKKESADNCLKQGKVEFGDNLVYLSPALSKENLDNKKNKKVAKDSRNLYLAKEGVIMAGSKAARGVSASDMGKRLELEQWKSQILKNLNMFISDKRLVIHNLPSTYDDEKLKALFMKHSQPKAIIKEAKVMRHKKKVGSDGRGVSKELGFVTFSTHEDALLALRNINNNPKIFTPNRRPIVGFSIENKAVLNLKQKRVEKSRIKLGIDTDKSNNKLMKLNRKQRRSIKRRAKLIEKRRETKKLKAEQSGDEKGKSEETKNEEPRKKRKRKSGEDMGLNCEPKIKRMSKGAKPPSEAQEFRGEVSEPGKKVKLRSRRKLKTQALMHRQNLKDQKARKMKTKKLEIVKQGKQKKGRPSGKVGDDSRVGALIAKRKKAFAEASSIKKWDEK